MVIDTLIDNASTSGDPQMSLIKEDPYPSDDQSEVPGFFGRRYRRYFGSSLPKLVRHLAPPPRFAKKKIKKYKKNKNLRLDRREQDLNLRLRRE